MSIVKKNDDTEDAARRRINSDEAAKLLKGLEEKKGFFWRCEVGDIKHKKNQPQLL